MKISNEVYFGGDYNPDQWSDEIIKDDIRMFKKAGINFVTLPVFSWAKLEPREGEYHFEWLDNLMDLLWENNIKVCLATPTTAQPAWLSTQYPEVLPVDIAGRKRTHGMRVFFCVNSPKYRERAGAIAKEMAKRYANHPALKVWHVSNEYGTYCYCPTCQEKFRQWLKERYKTIENLNEHWSTSFWGRTVYDFSEITLPTELNDDYRFNPVIQLDYMRFVTHSTAECFENEYNILKKYTPDIPVSTNISGYIKKLNQFEMLKHMDIAGWDNYPWPTDEPSFVAMKHTIMRGLKNGEPYMLTEQSPNQQNWQPYNKLKYPGEVRRLSYQAMAHGADTCLFFQMRQSIAGQEKFHGAIISHAGHENTRVFRECATIGNELKTVGDVFLGGHTISKVAILMDWESWWALELCSGPNKDIDFLQNLHKYFKAFHSQNIATDIISVESDLNKYDVVVAPMLYMMKENIDEKIRQFVKNGGSFIATTMTGLADENDRCIFGEYPGLLKDILGIWVEETDALTPDEQNILCAEKNTFLQKSEYTAKLLCDIIHLRQAVAIAKYKTNFYAQTPAVTQNQFGKGKAYYIGTQPEQSLIDELAAHVCNEHGIKKTLKSQDGLEITCRQTEKDKVYFIINHSNEEKIVDFENLEVQGTVDGKAYIGKTAVQAGDVLLVKASL